MRNLQNIKVLTCLYADFGLRNVISTLNSVPTDGAQYTGPFTSLPKAQYVTFKLEFDKECAHVRIRAIG
jgi:hypothetical protein